MTELYQTVLTVNQIVLKILQILKDLTETQFLRKKEFINNLN